MTKTFARAFSPASQHGAGDTRGSRQTKRDQRLWILHEALLCSGLDEEIGQWIFVFVRTIVVSLMQRKRGMNIERKVTTSTILFFMIEETYV